MFPDNWDRDEIIDEVTYAVENNKWKIPDTRNTYKWFSKDWSIEIHFYLDEKYMKYNFLFP
jgi:hypothetical protein